jgi:hypothetical protein
MWLVLLLYVWKIPGSDLGSEVSFSNWGFLWFFSVHPGKCPEHTPSFHVFSDLLFSDLPIV